MTTSGGFPEGFEPDPEQIQQAIGWINTGPEQIGAATGQPNRMIRSHSVLECFSVDQDQAWFRKPEEGDTDGPWVTLSIQHFHAMGEPGKITVTVEPGDRLTGEGVTASGHHSRSAQSGKFVTDEFAAEHPDTAVTEEG